jgi:hypothetical protein
MPDWKQRTPVARFVDRVGGVLGEPGAYRVVQGVAVQAGQEPSQCGGVRCAGSQPEPFTQVAVGIGGEAGDGGQRRGSAEDGDQAQREQGAQAVAAASDPAAFAQIDGGQGGSPKLPAVDRGIPP